VNAGIGVDQNTFGGEPLGAVAGDGITMIEVAMFFGIEFNLTIVFESASDAAFAIPGGINDSGPASGGRYETFKACSPRSEAGASEVLFACSNLKMSSTATWITHYSDCDH
jgi:hypothetical protein